MAVHYDVLVIGGSTTGCYFAHEMAVQGYKVAVADALPAGRIGGHLPVFHVDKPKFGELGIPRPEPGDPDYLGEFADGRGSYYPPSGQYMKRDDPSQRIIYADYPFLVCALPPFIQRLRAWCAEAGVEFLDETKFLNLIYCKHGVRGAHLTGPGGEAVTVYARLVADCSGKEAVVRRSLRKPTPVEDFEVGPRDSMHVILKFLKLKYPGRDAPQRAEHWAYYKGWIGQSQSPDVAVIGTGAALSFEYTEKCMERFLAAVEMPEGEIIDEQRGSLPFRRPPYSLVDSGFVALGDAACMNKWVGEGICSAWVGCQMAAEVAGEAMRNGAYPTLEALWPLNVRYNTTQQADFAYINATAINAVDCSPEEMDYEFEKGIVFTDKAMTRLNWEYSAEMPPNEVAQLIAKLGAGLASGNISPHTLKGMLKGVAYSTLLKAHYKAFPKTPAGFGDWADGCGKLWEECGNIADVTERVEARNNG